MQHKCLLTCSPQWWFKVIERGWAKGRGQLWTFIIRLLKIFMFRAGNCGGKTCLFSSLKSVTYKCLSTQICVHMYIHTHRETATVTSGVWLQTATGIKVKPGGISYVTAKPAQRQHCQQKYNYLSIMNPGETPLWNIASREAAQKKLQEPSFSGWVTAQVTQIKNPQSQTSLPLWALQNKRRNWSWNTKVWN